MLGLAQPRPYFVTFGKSFHLSGPLEAFSALKFCEFIGRGSIQGQTRMTGILLSTLISGAVTFGPSGLSHEEVAFLPFSLCRWCPGKVPTETMTFPWMLS